MSTRWIAGTDRGPQKLSLQLVPEKISVKLRPSLRYHLGAEFHWNKVCYGAADNDQPGLFHRHHEPSPACA